MITKLLVANRAEIASRVFRTCRELGIATVAIHSDADADLPYVAEADEVVHLPGNTPGETYLDAEAVLDAARATGAEAIHPGYGFLSENAGFARAVEAAGIRWVGPTPESIEAMGDKIRAKELMAEAGVPVLSAPENPTDADLPLLVKASAGGGGRGMRIVRQLADLESEIETAKAEAASAFGDGTVFVEPYIETGRHVEVQVVGDGHGGVAVFGERDCSMQRRHQKVVEEAPAPGLSDEVRSAFHEAARKAAAAVDYRGAGTVEFLYDPATERFFFLEMNTRLQVEHPVTEEIFGVDLVAAQIAVAEGRGLDKLDQRGSVEPVETTGHAIEVRLYAEDPGHDYQPQSGRLTRFEIPAESGVRVDGGFGSGNEVSTFYDAMLAKVIVHADTREQAIRKLAGVLRRARVHGLVTNREQLLAILADDRFVAGDVSTDLLASIPANTSVEPVATTPAPAAIAAALALAERDGAARTVQAGIPVAWRNVISQPQRAEFAGDLVVEWFGGRDGYTVDGATVVSASPTDVTLEVDGVRTTYEVTVTGDSDEQVDVDWPAGHLALIRTPRFIDPADAVSAGSLLAPMPGTVTKVAVEQGAEVAAGDTVLVLEAMKMQHTIAAPTDGVVTEISVSTGSQVASGDVLAVVSSESTEPAGTTEETA